MSVEKYFYSEEMKENNDDNTNNYDVILELGLTYYTMAVREQQ